MHPSTRLLKLVEQLDREMDAIECIADPIEKKRKLLEIQQKFADLNKKYAEEL